VPEHAPPLHTFWHGAPFCQAPFESHVCGVTPLQPVLPGVHVPVQEPATQAWFTQVTGALHCPTALHVWTPLLEHCFAPGVQIPVQVPLTQADPAHVTAVPHCPFEPHV
jgi:hypothetical protein